MGKCVLSRIMEQTRALMQSPDVMPLIPTGAWWEVRRLCIINFPARHLSHRREKHQCPITSLKQGPIVSLNRHTPTGVCYVLLGCRKAGCDLQLFSHPGTPLQLYVPCFTPVPMRTAQWSFGMEHITKNKLFFSPKAKEGYQPQNSSPFSPSTLPPATRTPALSSLCAPCEETGDLGKKKKKRLSHEVIVLSHFYSSAFSRCLQLSLFYSCTWLLRLWSSPLLHILWCVLAYIVCNLTPCHLIPPTSHNPYQPLSPPFHLSFV